MMNKETNEEIANRLGIEAPMPSQEVAQYLQDIDAYNRQIRDLHGNNSLDSLPSWNKSNLEVIACNVTELDSRITKMQIALALGRRLASYGDDIETQANEYQKKKWDYSRSIDDELNRPSREFYDARYKRMTELYKEKRSLAVKVGKGWAKYHKQLTTEDRARELEIVSSMGKRLEIVENALKNIERLRFTGNDFTSTQLEAAYSGEAVSA
jgi:hypothetical protein